MGTYIHECVDPDFSFASNLQGLSGNIFSFTFQFPKVGVCCSADVGPAQFHRVLFSRRHWNVSGLNNFIGFPKNYSKSTDVIGDLHNWELVGLTKEKTESTVLCKDSSIAYPEATKFSVSNRRFLS